MKKFTRILAVCLLVAIAAMSFVSCGLMGLDLEKTEEKLDDAGYDVCYVEDVENVKASDYEEYVLVLTVAYLFEELDIDEEPVALLMAQDDDEALFAVEFESAKDATEAFEDLDGNWEKLQEESGDGSEKEIAIGKNGKVIYFGTVQAVKDALGFPGNLLVFAK